MGAKNNNHDSEDLQTYVKLMTEHQWTIRGFIVSLMPGSPDVGDVLQETNIVLWQKRERFEPGTNFLGWASRIARYEVMHHRDRVKRVSALPFSDTLINMLADMGPPDRSQDLLLTALDGCLEKLNPKQRALVAQRYSPGRTLEDLAANTGTTGGSLRVTLHRIRQALKRCIEDSLEGRPA